MIELYLNENSIDVDKSIDEFKKQCEQKLITEQQKYRKQCVTEMTKAINETNEELRKEIQRVIAAAKS
ncbi:MAG: hypothetical protein RBR71_11495 [Gudongella sp.]|nr:hypothetical protein [Gudongella sp.]